MLFKGHHSQQPPPVPELEDQVLHGLVQAVVLRLRPPPPRHRREDLLPVDSDAVRAAQEGVGLPNK